MQQKKILVLGGGLAGLSASWHLQKRGADYRLFEQEDSCGGLCRSKRVKGFIFDYDGHLMHFKYNYTQRLIKQILGDNLLEHKRNASVYLQGKYIPYPFQANLYGLDHEIIKECLVGFIEVNRKNGKTQHEYKNFLEWINRTFGKGIARHFMIPYNKKFWTIPPEKLICDWLYGFIPVPSLTQLIDGTVQKSSELLGYNANFYYPAAGGIGRIPQGLCAGLKNVYNGHRVEEIDIKNKTVRFNTQEKIGFDKIISTIPLPELSKIVKGLPQKVREMFNKLRWVSVFNLNLGLEGNDFADKHWIYFPEDKFCFFRVGFAHNFSPSVAPSGKSSLYAEVSYSRSKPINKARIIADIKDDLKKAGILPKRSRILAQDINDIKYAYPVYDHSYLNARDGITGYLKENNIITCGRFGSWRYLSMEDTILDGKIAAEAG